MADFQDFTAADAAKKPAEAVKAEVAAPPGQLLNSQLMRLTHLLCSAAAQAAQPPAPMPVATLAPPMATTPSSSDGDRVAASPFAKKLATEANIQLVDP